MGEIVSKMLTFEERLAALRPTIGTGISVRSIEKYAGLKKGSCSWMLSHPSKKVLVDAREYADWLEFRAAAYFLSEKVRKEKIERRKARKKSFRRA